jgi:hypothetical protein
VAQRNGGREREQHRIWGEHPRRRYLSLAIGGQAGVNPTRRTVNKMSVARMSSLALASPRTQPGGHLLDDFLADFGGVSGAARAHANLRADLSNPSK